MISLLEFEVCPALCPDFRPIAKASGHGPAAGRRDGGKPPAVALTAQLDADFADPNDKNEQAGRGLDSPARP